MKIKGIPVWEQHLEFIVLGVAVLVLLGFAALQFTGSPNVREIPGGGGEVLPSDVDAKLVERARALQSDLQSNPDRVYFNPPASERAALVVGPVSPGDSLRIPGYYPSPETNISIEPGTRFAVPTVPQPARIQVVQSFDTVVPEFVDEHPELSDILEGPPYDLTWNTVVATFDLGAVRNAFEQADEGLSPPPSQWFNDRVTVLDVMLVRERYQEGQWTEATEIVPLPEQITYREDLQGDVQAAIRDWILEGLADPGIQLSLMQPEPLPMVNGFWQEPDPREEGISNEPSDDPDARRIRNLQSQLRRSEQQLQSAKDALEEAGGPLADSAPAEPDRSERGGRDDDRGRGGGGVSAPGVGAPGVGAPGGGAGSRSRTNPSGASDPKDDNLRRRLTRTVAQLERTVERLQKQIADLGVEVEAPPVDLGPVDKLAADELVVWAHDIDVKPGETYRYQLRVDVYNPFFLKGMQLIDEQQPLADEIMLSSPFSEWSQPVDVKPSLRWYVTSATLPNSSSTQIGGADFGQATVEVFAFQHGQWWSERFSGVRPGERIGEVRRMNGANGPVEIDFRTDWQLLDIVPDISLAPNVERGEEGMILVQHTQRPDQTEWRRPVVDKDRPDRDDLEGRVGAGGTQVGQAEDEAGGL